MDLKEIEQVPLFKSDIDPLTLSKLDNEGDRLLAESFSTLRQEVRWASEHVLIAYNLAVQTSNKSARERSRVLWLIVAALITLIADHLTLK